MYVNRPFETVGCSDNLKFNSEFVPIHHLCSILCPHRYWRHHAPISAHLSLTSPLLWPPFSCLQSVHVILGSTTLTLTHLGSLGLLIRHHYIVHLLNSNPLNLNNLSTLTRQLLFCWRFNRYFKSKVYNQLIIWRFHADLL